MIADAPWWDHGLIGTVASAVISLLTVVVYHYFRVSPLETRVQQNEQRINNHDEKS